MAAERKPDLIDELRMVLPDTPRARAVLERVQEALAPDHLLTTREAADFLGIRSVNTLKALLHAERVPRVKVGTHTRIARRELERLLDSRRTRAIQCADRAWDQVDEAFGEDGLTQEQTDMLAQTHPHPLAARGDPRISPAGVSGEETPA